MIEKEEKSMMRVSVVLSVLALCAVAAGEEGMIEFDPDRWDMAQAKVVDHLGRKALMGTANLKALEFENGVIEVDVAVTGARSYPGILFRTQPGGHWERFYIRPHRAGCVPPSLYTDVLQYVPAWNGVDSWQLHTGAGRTAGFTIPLNQWVRVRLEVSGTQARVFVGESAQPALLINDLQHGGSKGGIGLMGPLDGTAYFSRFSYRPDDALRFDPPPVPNTAPGIISKWQLSKPFKALRIDTEKTPEAQGLTDLGWQDVVADSAGVVDVSHRYGRSGEPDCVFARTTIRADAERTLKLNLGYSDIISAFINSDLVFTANSAYGSRDPSFLGVLGFNDTLYLPLRKGDNELLLAVTELSGGWGFMAQDADTVFLAPGVEMAWETPKELSLPESAVYDPVSGAVYVSNWDGYNRGGPEAKQFISKISPDGKLDKLQWVAGLRNPTGLATHAEKLYAVEANSVVEISIPEARIVKRHDLPGSAMLNDITVTQQGDLYISDTRKGVIFRLAGGKAEEWLSSPELARPNGVHVRGDALLIGSMGDGWVKEIKLATKEIRKIADLGPGIIDGIESDQAGGILVSHFNGRLFRIGPNGEVTKLLDLTAGQTNIADIGYIPGKNMVICPATLSGRIGAYRIGGR
ncbi:MAG: hypothetical protein AB1714_09735 [Acidobacteriota bacterium]